MIANSPGFKLAVVVCHALTMEERTWRPLGVVTDDEVREYDALYDDIPAWMEDAYWAWIKSTLSGTTRRSGPYNSINVPIARTAKAEQMCQTLHIRLPSLIADSYTYERQISTIVSFLKAHPNPLQIADYLLAFDDQVQPDRLEAILTRSKSAWMVGTRSGRPGLVRRVPSGVQDALDSVMERSQRAGVRLAKAWEKLYGLVPDPGSAYWFAVKAIEDASIPVVSPKNVNATLGTVISQMENQTDWSLPIRRTHPKALPGPTVLAMMRMVWVGERDRHGGSGEEAGESLPPDVTFEEAVVAVSLAVTLVNLFDAGLIARSHTSVNSAREAN